MMKRIFDIISAVLALIISLPLLILTGLSIKIEGGGPFFYRQVRLGLGRKHFLLYKFRSMVMEADRKGPLVTSDGDSRITRIGGFLRRTKLDELPQLLNVVKGDMSIVGPRPEAPRYIEHYHPEWERVFSARPGITDLATLQFRDEQRVLAYAKDKEKAYIEIVMPMKMKLALYYVNNRSFWLDLKIIALTFWGITLGRLFAKPDDSLAERAIAQIESLNI